MQRTAQDWLVLTVLTHSSATALGVVTALQFTPIVLLLPLTGWASDHLDRRRLLMATQAVQGVLALALGVLTVTGLVTLGQVYVFALLLGVTTAFDGPARQTFVAELVPETELGNAVALNSTSFNLARMVGPAVAGVLIAAVGTGWVFLLNGLSFVAVLGSLLLLRPADLRARPRPTATGRASLLDGFRAVRSDPLTSTVMLMMLLVGTFGLQFQIFVPTMSVAEFGVGSAAYGMLTSVMAVGSVAGALLAARRSRPGMAALLAGAAVFAVGLGLAAAAPGYWLFAVVLVLVGVAAQTFSATSNTLVQLSTAPHLRGRVMAIYLAVARGGAPVGALLLGWVADAVDPRAGLTVGALAALGAVVIGLRYLVRHRGLHVEHESWHVHLALAA
ncbi:putative MFS family arabinose efflux permease [Sediminihabitans luteus]|uniref:Putative MFS family arabinose efflux permease n=2 Tax=Sediminihabitans luteus TaxID=1138585 RepID=A0A2M9CES4_9CELL|nr:putative MFS family arabinose efflux permease [Sediminihabitans luteus]GII97896.1 MFS transporter [Sediminihabitans luteus]